MRVSSLKKSSDPLRELMDLTGRGKKFTNEDVLLAVEHVAQRTMPDLIKQLIIRAKFPSLKKRGHPVVFGAAQDFALADLIEEYPKLVKKYKIEAQQKKAAARDRGGATPKGEDSPSDRALKQLMSKYKKELGVISVQSLRNMITNLKKGKLYRPHGDPEPVDLDRVVKQFAARKSSL